jgi:NAD(P)H dehydrogenase (quinone)
MNISVILAHPDKTSFNHSIATTILETLRQNKHHFWFHDLYAENFPPLLPHEEFDKNAQLPSKIEQHCKEICSADGIIIIHPNWWGQPPAILKGWIDRVIRPGRAYEFLEGDNGEGVPNGLLKANSALVFNTSNTETEREQKVFGDPLETIWKNCIFDLCGVTTFYRRMFNIIVISSEEQRRKWLADVRMTINHYYPESTEKS